VEIFGNNTAASISYTYNGVAQTLAANTQDIWVNTVNIGNDLLKAQITGNSTINSWMMTGKNSVSNAANVFIDDMTYSNSIASGYTSYLNYYSKSSGNLNTLATWSANRDGSGYLVPANFTTSYRKYNIVNNVTPTGATIGGNWTVSGTASKVVVGDEGASGNSYIFKIPASFKLTGIVDVTNDATLRLQNTILPTLGTLSPYSVVDYNNTTATQITVAMATYGDLQFTGDAVFNINSAITVTGSMEIDLGDINLGKVIVKAGKSLTVNGSTLIWCPECLVLESTSAGVASFIDHGMNYYSGDLGLGSVKVQDYRVGAGGTTPNGRFHYASIPVTAATRAVYEAGSGNKVWYFSEATNAYTKIDNNTTALSVGKGYLIRLGANTTLSFSGNVNTGNINFSNLASNGPLPNRGYHLVGNPYPSTLDWEATNKTHLEPTIWYRTANLSGTMVFDTYNALNHQGTNNNGSGAVTKDIPPMQAFWVKVDVDGTTGNLGLTNAMRSHAQDALYVAGPSPFNRLKFRVTSNGQSDETILLFDEQADNGYEDWDSKMMFNTTGTSLLIPQLFTVIPNKGNMTINSFDKLIEAGSMPLGFKTNVSGEFSIIPDLSSFNAGTILLLEDTELDTIVDVWTTPEYTFTSDSVQTITRFILHFTPSETTGFLTYGDTQESAPGLNLALKNTNGEVLESITSASDGAFKFNQAEPGINNIHCTSTVPSGGINAADALLVMKHFVQVAPLTGLSLKAADVNADGAVNAIDALMILKFFVGQLDSFPAGTWQFEPDSFNLNAAGQQQTFNMKILATGDIDQSYNP